MNIKHLQHQEIDKNKWDACIAQSVQKIIYAYSWYLDVVSPNWEALVLGDYEAIFPLCWKKKFGLYYLYQPAFTQQLGIFSKLADNQALNNLFLEAIPLKFKLIEININTKNQIHFPKDFQETPNITHHLDLSNPYEAISEKYVANLHRNLIKAQKSRFEFIKEPNIDDLIELFRTHKGKDIYTLSNDSYKKLGNIVNICQQKEKIKVYAIRLPDEKISAGMCILEDDKHAIFLFSALSEKGKKTGAMPLLIDTYIKQHAEKGILFDFEGSNDKNIARFYRGFGSKEYVYLHLKKNKLPFYIRWFKN